jgi:phenylacetate-CoA ligase
VLGRERNLILMPDGSRHWPLVGFARFRDVAPVTQYQMIQTSRDEIEVRLVTETPLDENQVNALSNVIRGALGHPFALRFVYFEGRIPAGPRGKFEEFVSRV